MATRLSKLASKADLSRLEKLEQQVDGVMNDGSSIRSKMGEGTVRYEEVSGRLELLRDQVCSLESKLGGPASSLTGPGRQLYGQAGGQGSGASSVVERLQRLERRAEQLGEVSKKSEGDVAGVTARLQELEPRVDASLATLRSDIRQALTLTSASSRNDLEAEIASRLKEGEKRTLSRINSVEESLETKISGMGSRVGSLINGELDKRFQSVYDHVDFQVSQLQTEMDRLSREKVDLTALELYTGKVSELFEQLKSLNVMYVLRIVRMTNQSLRISM
eukprot:gene16296-22484_t